MPKVKKPTPENLKHIVKLRDEIQAAASKDERKLDIGMMCKGMYKCSKENDKDCLDKIEEKLTKEHAKLGTKKSKRSSSKSSSSKKVGGGSRKKSRSRSKSRKR